ncbi:MAG: hypothetical protein WBA17_16445 [Saprospiraceae bacterium]
MKRNTLVQIAVWLVFTFLFLHLMFSCEAGAVPAPDPEPAAAPAILVKEKSEVDLIPVEYPAADTAEEEIPEFPRTREDLYY